MKRSQTFASALVLLLLSVAVFGQTELSIAQVQGDGNISPFAGKRVRVSGVITARTRNGFFIQTPDAAADKDPATSEAVFVFTGGRDEPPKEAVVGNMVSVTGNVEEFRRDNEPFVLTLTEIAFEKMEVISTGNALPAAVELKIDAFRSNKIDQLERYEGMRVFIAEVSVVQATGGRTDAETASIISDGAFGTVLKGVARPFREPGLDIRELLMSAEADFLKKAAPKMLLYDSNPEAFRIDTDEQFGFRTSANRKTEIYNGPALDVPAQATIADINGVMHYAYGRFTILTDPDKTPKPLSTIKPDALPRPTADQFSVAGMNLENFFDDDDDPSFKEPVVSTENFNAKMAKISIAFRDYLRYPDVVAVVEAENLSGLKRLAEKINSDAKAAGEPDPKYQAFLEDGNDGRGIDNGFLVKTSRVKVLETKQLGKDEKYKHPRTGEKIHLNDRPPFLIRVAVENAKGEPFEFTAIANHLKSYLGYNVPRQSENVRMKKILQAEYLARIVDERQKSDPKERIMLLGDFNSFQFSDGILDMIGTIKGTPSAKDSVLFGFEDLVETDLINLVELVRPNARYSYTFDTSAQTLDHILISRNLEEFVNGFGFARVNADFPKILANDAARVERFSDHDPAVAYFRLPWPPQ